MVMVTIDVLFPLAGWLIEGFVYPQLQQVNDGPDGIPNRPKPIFCQKDIIDGYPILG